MVSRSIKCQTELSSCEDADKSDVCVRSEEEKKRILDSCHAAMEGRNSFN